MATYLIAKDVDTVPEAAPVHEYDDLDEDEQEAVRQLVDGETVTGTRFDSDFVRYDGECYHIDRVGLRASD